MTIKFDAHEDCRVCDGGCDRHLQPIDQWPCLVCGLMLCGSCDCPTQHVEENCS